MWSWSRHQSDRADHSGWTRRFVEPRPTITDPDFRTETEHRSEGPGAEGGASAGNGGRTCTPVEALEGMYDNAMPMAGLRTLVTAG